MKIDGKVAVVVGAARGIGLAYVEALLSKGAKVHFADVLVEEGRIAECDLRAKHGVKDVSFHKCDVRLQSDVDDLFKAALDEHGTVDILVNSAGIIHEFKWEDCFNINMFGVIRTTEAAFKVMGKNKGGKGGVIINTSSITGLYIYDWGPVYCATKHAILAYTRIWAMEENFRQHGVRLNTICPHYVQTKLVEHLTPEHIYNAGGTQDQLKELIAIQPKDVAVVLVSLIEDDTKNGTAQLVDYTGVTQVEFLRPS